MGLLRDIAYAVLQRTQWERLILKEPDHTDKLAKLMQTVQESNKTNVMVDYDKPITDVTAKAGPKIEPAIQSPGEVVSPEKVMAWQRQKVYQQLFLLQDHLNSGCRIDGDACDCCMKHALALEALAEEDSASQASVIRRLIRREAKKRDLWPRANASGQTQNGHRTPGLPGLDGE